MSDTKLSTLKLSNCILAIGIVIAFLSMLFGIRENSRLRLEKQLLQRQLEELAKAATDDVPRVGDLVPPIEGDTVQQERVRIDYGEKSRYLLFFISFQCADSIEQLPNLNEIAKTAKTKNVTVLGLSTDKHYVPVNAPEHSFEILTVTDAAFLRAYRVTVTPTIILLSDHGRAQWVHAGILNEANTQELLRLL